MNDLTNNEIIFLMKLMDGIANGIEAIDPQPFSDEDDLSSAYNCAIKLRKKLFDELERRIRDDDGCDKLMEAGPKWISVKDRLPPMYHKVLITGKNSAGGSFGVIKGSHDGDKEGQWYRDDIGQYVNSSGDTVTHWMPLPEPPKEVT